jgi:WD40 repeat protein
MLYTTSHDGYFRVRDLAHDHLLHSLLITQTPLTTHAKLAEDLIVTADIGGMARIIDLRAQSIVMNVTADEHLASPLQCLTATQVAQGKKTKYLLESSDPNAKLALYAGYGDGRILSWDLRFPKVICDSYFNTEESVNSMAVYNGKLYSGGDDCSINVSHDIEGTHMDVLGGMQSWVSKVAMHEHLLFGADMLGQVRLYDTQEVSVNIVRRQMEMEAKEDLLRENAAKLKELSKKMKRSKKKKEEKKNTYTRRI